MTKYLIASPDRYGRFGHQTLSISAGLLLAAVTGSKLIRPKYMYFCDKWNKYIDFSRSKYVCSSINGSIPNVAYVEDSISDANGNRKFDTTDSNSIHQLVNQIHDTLENSLVHLPFDQGAGKLLRLYNKKEIRHDLRQIHQFQSSKLLVDKKYVCIHVRRGDCTQASHPAWFVNDAFYINLLEMIDKVLPDSWSIVVCTQGDISWIKQSISVNLLKDSRLKIFSTAQLFINDREIEDFSLMKDAEILFGTASSFSLCALLFGEHKLAFDVTRSDSHPIDDVIRINPDHEIKHSFSMIESALERIFK